MFILLSSCSDKAYENKNLIIFYDKSSVCKTKIYDFAEKNKLKIVYDMKNINSIVIGGIKKLIITELRMIFLDLCAFMPSMMTN